MSEDQGMREGAESGMDADVDMAEGLAAKLAGYRGPAYRKAYLKNLLQSGNRFLEAGNARGARYCFDKVAEGLNAASAKAEEEDSDSESSDAPADSQAQSHAVTEESQQPASDTAPREQKPRAPRAKPKEKPLSATERVRRQWRLERIQDAENVLGKHGGRLSALESQSYRERLEKLRQSGQAATTAVQSDRADAALLELRRRLYQRVLKSQRISLTSLRMPMTLARLALPPQTGFKAAPARLPAPTGKIAPAVKIGSTAKVQVDREWQPVVGPYNDRYNMEDLLSLITDADPAWVQEFLDLYRGLSGMQDLVTALALAKK